MTKVDGPVPLSLEGVASTLVSRPSTCHNICGQFRGTLHSTIGPHTFSHDSGTSSPQPGFSNLSSGGNFLSRTLGKHVKSVQQLTASAKPPKASTIDENCMILTLLYDEKIFNSCQKKGKKATKFSISHSSSCQTI